MAKQGDVSPLLDLIHLTPVWDALTGSQRHEFTYLSGRRGIRAQASHILSASSSAITCFFHEESRHLTQYFPVAPDIKPVNFKVTTWLKFTSSQLALEPHRPFGEELQVGKHYSQYSKMCPNLTGYQRSRRSDLFIRTTISHQE